MIIVAIFVILAFAWFFNPYDTRQGSLNETQAFRVGNQSVSAKEVDRQQRIAKVATELGFNFINDLLRPRFDIVEFAQNRLILKNEARKYGIDPSEKEVEEAISAHTQFQTSGKFDPGRYTDAIKNQLNANGLQPGDLRSLVADKLRIERLTELLASNLQVPDSQVEVDYQRDQEEIHSSVIEV